MTELPSPDTFRAAVLRAIHEKRNLVEQALRHQDDYSFEDVVADVVKEKLQVWFNPDAIALTEVRSLPTGPMIFVHLAAGKFEAILELEQVVREFGRMIGARKMAILGRQGFTRRLKKHGWQQPYHWMEKPL